MRNKETLRKDKGFTDRLREILQDPVFVEATDAILSHDCTPTLPTGVHKENNPFARLELSFAFQAGISKFPHLLTELAAPEKNRVEVRPPYEHVIPSKNQ